ncbi:transglycosylase SLT domain-containing protein [Falsiroseomonas sp. HC035]|uniref:transglycosylase SLT domain-containing protein n=1 Tax=Falsiroseomonas sp. HC035 TaxID=3390999 RepID=UPI003D312200
MKLRALIGFACVMVPGIAAAQPAAGEICLPAIAAAEQEARLPQHLLRSIAHVESGRRDPATGRWVPWPWAINAAGAGHYFETKEAAIEAVQGFLASGIRSIDVGCAQVNLLHHPAAFASLEEAFDPATNTAYAARFLNFLRRTTGSWPLAAAGYHSMTPTLGIPYARRVMAVWPGSARHGALPELAPDDAAPATDYSAYTPGFAAVARRIDAARQGAARAAGLPPGPVWINRPPEPVRVLPAGSRSVAGDGPGRNPG